MNWAVFDEQLGQTYDPSNGAPGVSTRLMVALHYLKYQHDLSDEVVVAQWVENPYWQHFSGMQFFEHEFPVHPSSMSRWRKRLGEAGAEAMLKSTIDTGLKIKVITPLQIERVNVDTTVQTKAVRFPTDARLYERARERLVKTARKQGLSIKQSYERVGRRLEPLSPCPPDEAGPGVHPQTPDQFGPSDSRDRTPTITATRTARQVTGDRQTHPYPAARRWQKVYSVHEPEVACIAKGKAGKKYEFGNKVSLAATSKGGWLLGALSLLGNPYDGHTLDEQLTQVRRLVTGHAVKEGHVDMGYRGNNHQGPETIIVDKRRRGSIPKRVWKWMKRRAAIEPTIGHLKAEHRLERNRLKGTQGNAINALLSAAAMNFQKLLGFFLCLLLRFLRSLSVPASRGQLLVVMA